MNKLIIPIIATFGIILNAGAKEKKSYKERKGDKYVFTYNYDKAIESYENTKHLSADGQRKLAESYHFRQRNVESETVYSKLMSKREGIVAEDYFNYAMVLKTNGKYEEANRYLDTFQLKMPNDLRAKSFEANKADLNDLKEDHGKFKINYLDINSKEDDFGTSFYRDKIVYSSTQSTSKFLNKKYNWNGKPYLDLMVVDVENYQFKNPTNFDKSLNGKLHEGPASFSNNGNFMVYTRNNYETKHKEKVVNLQLFFLSNMEGKWSEPIPFIYNSAEYSVGHPSLSEDGNTLYFTSDMPGGFGKADIYKTTKNDKGEWAKPVNMGSTINTEEDEMFPYFAETQGMLFFSSNGRFGIGGLDIFNCVIEGDQIGSVYNVGYPLNSQNDDYAFIVDSTTNIGYFSSNRSGVGEDIYSVEITGDFKNSKKVKGLAIDKNGTPVSNTLITLFDEQKMVLDTFSTEIDGAFFFLADPDKKYVLIGEKEGYLEGVKLFNTLGKENTISVDVVMLKEIDSKIKVGEDLGKILELKTSYSGDLKTKMAYFDLDKSNIRPDAKIELDKICKIMNEYPTMIIELGSFTDCSGREVYNQGLSERRAKSSIDYIKSRISKPERIYGKGYGETKLLNGCNCEGTFISTCPDNENQKNRRTEFIIIQK